MPQSSKHDTTDLLGAFYEAHITSVYRYFYGHVRHHALAEDLTSEAFEKVSNHWPPHHLPTTDAQRRWLFRIAQHCWFDHLRRERRRPMVPLADDLDDPDHETRMDVADRLDMIDALATLSSRERDIVLLKTASVPNDAIAALWNISAERVRQIYISSLSKLRSQLTEQEKETV